MSKTRNLANSAPQFNALVVPVGSTAQRPSATPGYIRFNTDLGTLESANSTAWANVGSGSASSAYSANTTATDFLSLPQGTTAQRPVNVANGAIRWNTSNNWAEMYTGTSTGWVVIAYGGQYTVEYLVVAGGGGGGCDNGGGGGAGGYLSGSTLVTPITSYSIIVGSGGSGSSSGSAQATNGSTSTFNSISSVGGGGGGSNSLVAGVSGGSGGGHGGGSGSGGSGTVGQGNPGGNFTSGYGGGGGGGAGASGTNTNGGGANGGNGLNWLSLGNYYAGGGGGGGNNNGPQSTGGLGGGGSGSPIGSPNTSTAGATNTGGGGGGGGGANAAGVGQPGGSGIVIIRYVGTQRATGGTISSSGGYTYHTFTSSGTFIA